MNTKRYNIFLTGLVIILMIPATLKAQGFPYELPKLPYAYNALEPAIDAATMEIHPDLSLLVRCF